MSLQNGQDSGVSGISIVVTVKNEGGHIVSLLQSLFSQSYPNIEIIIVDDMSEDGTMERVTFFHDVKYIRERCSRGGGRNIGAKNAKYDTILFTDGDSVVSKEWVSGMAQLFNAGYDAVIGKTVLVGNDHFRQERVKVFYNDIEVTAPSVNLGYRKQKFFEIGGFDESFVTAEDIDLNIRAAKSGFKFGYCDTCIVYAKVRNNLPSYLRQAFWNGYGRGQLAEKHPDVFSHTSIGLNYDIFNIMRLLSGFSGFVYYKIKGKTNKLEKKH